MDLQPMHNVIIKRQYLEQTFNRRWMGTRGTVAWPLRLPNLKPLDISLHTYLKTIVYSHTQKDFHELKNKISIVCEKLMEEEIFSTA